MNCIILETIEEPGLDTHKVGTLEAPSIGSRDQRTLASRVRASS
jgi:hypothetical protein